MGVDGRLLVSMSDRERARKFLEPILTFRRSRVWHDAELVKCLADQFAEVRRQALSRHPQCTCAAIQNEDDSRHFRECPLRKEHGGPDGAWASGGGSR
jgi:hypothetical protein